MLPSRLLSYPGAIQSGVDSHEIGIIAPYRAQTALIRQTLTPVGHVLRCVGERERACLFVLLCV